ncbi:MAG: chorismate mutase [SAR324 cluster bacterium]|nr:chorismate mutase [SAR324 cluster bacterium]
MNLDELRLRIDELDETILRLVNQRAECVREIGQIKRQSNQDVFVPEREKRIMERLINLNQGPLSDHAVQHIFQQIIETLKTLQ